MARSSDGQSSLSRAVALLETFDTGTRDLSASQIATRAGVPLSTAHRIIGELVSLGLLERLSDRRYRMGLRLWEIAVRTPGALGIREIALDTLRATHARIGQNLQLGVLQGTEVLYLERLSTPTAAVNFVVVGGRIPFHATSSGLVLVAHLDSAEQQRTLASPLPKYASTPLPAPNAMAQELAEIRRNGFAITRGYIDAAATSIAVPIKGATGKAVAAISAIVPTDDTREELVLPVLHAAAASITKAIRRTSEG